MIDLLYTGRDSELELPRLFLGGVLWHDMHWRDGRTDACLRDYQGCLCKPCGQSRRYAFLAVALLHVPDQKVIARSDSDAERDARDAWRALSEEERQARIKARREAMSRAGPAPEAFIEMDCINQLKRPAGWIEPRVARLAVQCLPEWSLEDAGDLRGRVAVVSSRARKVTLRWLDLSIRDVPGDFDPRPIFNRRYGLSGLTRPPGDEGIIPFQRRQA